MNGVVFDMYAGFTSSVANSYMLYQQAQSNSNTQTVFGGYSWKSVATPAGNSCRVIGWLRDFVGTGGVAGFYGIRFSLADATTEVVNPSNYLRGGDFSTGDSNDYDDCGARIGATSTLPSSTWRVIANGYQFFAFADTVYSVATFIAAGVPWIPDFFYPKVISAATAASPIVITTSAAHGWTTGDAVHVAGGGGLTGLNGTFTVTVLTTTTASLGGSTGTGAYTSGGVAAELNTGIASIAWMMGSAFYGTTAPLYTALTPQSWVAQILNGSINDPRLTNGGGTSYGTGTAALLVPSTTLNTSIGDPVVWYNNDVLATEPLISMGTSDAGTAYLVGQLWDSFFHSKAETGGTTGTFDSKNWYILTNSATGSSTTKEGALVLRVP